jgi:hypothetical protein
MRVHRVLARQTTTGVAGDRAHLIITVRQQEMIVGWHHDPELRITAPEPKTTAESRAPMRRITTTPGRRVLVIQTIIVREREMIVELRHDPAYRITVREPKTIVE